MPFVYHLPQHLLPLIQSGQSLVRGNETLTVLWKICVKFFLYHVKPCSETIQGGLIFTNVCLAFQRLEDCPCLGSSVPEALGWSLQRQQSIRALRGHLKISHIADKRKNFHMGGRRFGPDSLCDRQLKKKKKKKKNAFALRCLQSQIYKKKCCESFSDLQGSWCMHADVVDQSQMPIVLSKGRLNFKALVGTRSSSTPSRSTPAARCSACRKKQVEVLFFFDCLRLSPCLL